MEELSLLTLVVLVGFGFLAAFIDAVVGGGGLISVPALLFVGLSPQSAVATNKLAGFFGLLASSFAFIRSGKVKFSLILKVLPVALLGALGGACVLHYLSSEFLRPFVLVLLIVIALYTFFKKDWKAKVSAQKISFKKMILFGIAVFCLAFYDGFFGPGTGSFLIFSFLLLGFDFLEAAGNAKLLNAASNISSLATYLFLGFVNFSYGLAMGLGMLVGAYVGARFALKRGVGYVRILFIVVTGALIIKNIIDYLNQGA